MKTKNEQIQRAYMTAFAGPVQPNMVVVNPKWWQELKHELYKDGRLYSPTRFHPPPRPQTLHGCLVFESVDVDTLMFVHSREIYEN